MPRKLHPPFAPMEAVSVGEISVGSEWQYEPKWDGFRCLVFRDGETVTLESKSGKSLSRYFPEIVEAVSSIKAENFALQAPRGLNHGPWAKTLILSSQRWVKAVSNSPRSKRFKDVQQEEGTIAVFLRRRR